MKASSANNYCYNKNLKDKANALRKNMTKAEACLWKYILRAGMMKGFTFRRQRPVLQYIADFMCKELLLIIEVDGITHSDPEVAHNDGIRQQNLEHVGFEVLRFNDEDILNDINCVFTEIEDKVTAIIQERGVLPPQRSRN